MLSSNQNQIIKDDRGEKFLEDNIWGSIEDDCIRRDFSINALYYCPIKGEIKDFSNGQIILERK